MSSALYFEFLFKNSSNCAAREMNPSEPYSSPTGLSQSMILIPSVLAIVRIAADLPHPEGPLSTRRFYFFISEDDLAVLKLPNLMKTAIGSLLQPSTDDLNLLRL